MPYGTNMLGGSGGPGGQGGQDQSQILQQLMSLINPQGQGFNNAATAKGPDWLQQILFGDQAGNSWFESLFGAPAQTKQYSQYTPLQIGALNQQLLQGAQNSDFGNIENLYTNKFKSEILPSIAERFTAMGAGGPSSSAFAGAVGQAGSGLASQLAALRTQYGQQQLQTGLRPQFENIRHEARQGYVQNAGGKAQDLAMKFLPLLLAA